MKCVLIIYARLDASGTQVSINYPLGVGIFIALECYREINQPDCGKLFNEAKNSKQLSCGKVKTL